MLGKLEEMRDKGPRSFGPGHSVSIFILLYCFFFNRRTEVFMSIQFNGMKWRPLTLHMLLPCSAPLLPNLKTDSRTSVCPNACSWGAREGNNNGGMLGTMRLQNAIRRETAYLLHIRIQNIPHVPTASDFVIAQDRNNSH